MSKFTGDARKDNAAAVGAVRNFMGGVSYVPSPITRARIMLSSGIFAEPSYYREAAPRYVSNVTKLRKLDDWIPDSTLSVSALMEKVIDAGLDHDFKAMIELAIILRHTYGMRLNPAVILVRAAVHPMRAEFTKKYPGAYATAVEYVARRPDDLTTMIEYYLASFADRKEGKNKIARLPGVLKRAIAAKLPQYDLFQMAKYQNQGIGLLDVINLTHPKPNDLINALVKDGKLEMPSEKKQARHLLSEGKSWTDILNGEYVITHQDLMYQMRNILTTVKDKALIDKALNLFVETAAKSNVWPHKYWTAWQAVRREIIDPVLRGRVQFAFERALNATLDKLPVQPGRVACLVDNSGSARRATLTDAGGARVCDVGNLSGILNALTCEEGYVGVFGDRLQMVPIAPDVNITSKMAEIDAIGERVGMETENGIWLFFQDAIENGVWWDTIWIYSDMQAGHGGLYVLDSQEQALKNMGGTYHKAYHSYVDVLKLTEIYRKRVNPKVNLLTVQIAGYDNAVLPESSYRTAILSGWTGMEPLFASAMIDAWDAQEIA